ncbi:MAG TPA: response regulator [Candidatus Paceibacterota bacterium]|nr:response regulator [Candidatus Paceibacterota bacterium]
MAETANKILVVEDDTVLFNAIKTKLEKNGYVVILARSGEETYAALRSVGPVDAVWLDHYLLGKESGIDVMEKLKADQTWKSIPVFVVSNTASPEKEAVYRELGAVAYYVKADHRLDEVVSEIGRYLKK